MNQFLHNIFGVQLPDALSLAPDKAGSSITSYTSSGDIATAINANGGKTTNSYGANDGESLTKSTSPTGSTTSMAYNNSNTSTNPTGAFQPSSSTDGQGNKSTMHYDGPGNLDSASNAKAAKADVDHNADGTMKSSTAPKNQSSGKKTTYSYKHHLLTKVSPPAGISRKAKTLNYDGWGNPSHVTDGNGHTLDYHYNPGGQLTKVNTSHGDSTLVTFSYDKAGNLVKRKTGSHTTKWTFDGANRMTSRKSSTGGGKLRYAYDAADNLTAVTDKQGTTHYYYNTRNWLTTMKDPAGIKTGFAYDKDGNRTKAYYGVSGDSSKYDKTYAARTTWSYDSSDRVKRVTTTRDHDSDKVVSDISYCYGPYSGDKKCSTKKADDTGLRQEQKDHTTDTVSKFTYGKDNRLTKATDVHGHDYTYRYDADGNRTKLVVDGKTTQQYSFNAGNELTGSGTKYDAAGNQTTTPDGTKLGYNNQQQLSKVTKDGATTHHKYLGLSNNELTSAGKQDYVWGLADQSGKPWLQSYTSSSDKSGYIHRDGNGTPVSLHADGHNYYYATDGLGPVTALVNSSGKTSAQYNYSPYGKKTANIKSHSDNTNAHAEAQAKTTKRDASANPVRNLSDGNSQGGAANSGSVAPMEAGGATNPHGYTSGINTGAGMVKMGARYYNPHTGTFTQQDAITHLGDPGNANPYSYAGDDPINQIDPTGMWSWSGFGKATLGGGVAGAAGGCATGAVATIWSGPGAAAGCGTGAAAGGAGGLVTGAVGYAWSQIW